MLNYEILRNDDDAVAIKINQRAYGVGFGRNQRLFSGGISFNINYSWLGKPIGILALGGSMCKNIITHETNGVRPCYCIYKDDQKYPNPDIQLGNAIIDNISLCDCVIQAGPLLVADSKNVVKQSIRVGKFQEDAVRKAKHVSIGIKGSNNSNRKTVVLYSTEWTLNEIAQYFIDNGCNKAMKLDGGHVAALRFIPHSGDKDNKPIWVGNKDITPIQMYFVGGSIG
jgi:hypothetical protein